MLGMYQLAILIGLVPLGILTISNAFSPHLKAEIQSESAAAEQQRPDANAVAVNRELFETLSIAIADPFVGSAAGLDGSEDSPGTDSLRSMLPPWRDFAKAREIAKQFASVAAVSQSMPKRVNPPRQVKSLVEMNTLVPVFAIAAEDAGKWLEKWEPRLQQLNSLAQLPAEQGTASSGITNIKEIAATRRNQLQEQVRQVQANKEELSKAKAKFATTIECFTKADELYGRKEYDESVVLLDDCDPRPPEVERLAALAEFYRDSDKVGKDYVQFLRQQEYQDSWMELADEMDHVVKKFAGLNGPVEVNRRAALSQAHSIVQARVEIEKIQKFELTRWVKRAKQIKQSMLDSRDYEHTNSYRTDDNALQRGRRLVSNEIRDRLIGDNGLLRAGLGRPKKSALEGLQEAINESNVVWLGLFEPFGGGQYYNYWESLEQKRRSPDIAKESVDRVKLRQLPREPLAVLSAQKYNERLRRLIKNPASRAEWQAAHDEFQAIETALTAHAAINGNRDGISLVDEIDFANRVLDTEIWNDIEYLLNEK